MKWWTAGLLAAGCGIAFAQDPMPGAITQKVVTAPPAPQAAAPAALPAPAAGETPSSLDRSTPPALPTIASPANVAFPRYDALKPAVSFWTRVFSQYSELQSVVHSTLYPNKVFTVLDYRDAALVSDRFRLDKRRREEEQATRDRIDKLLKRIHDKRDAPATMDREERRIYELFADVPGDDKFKKMIGTIRTQRGLKERTENALEISNRYLPTMEQTFRGYGLPSALTRLPLVESSFNLEAYSKAGAAGIWQFIPSSAKIYMRLNDVVDDRRDPWTSTDAAARHLQDDYALLQDWPLAITAYNHGRNGIARGLKATEGRSLMDLIARYDNPRFGFASKNYYAEFLAAVDIERAYRERQGALRNTSMEFEIVETKHYVPYETLRRLCGANDEVFRKLNPAYRPEVIAGKLYVPPGHLIRVPAGSARSFEVGYSRLGNNERFDSQRAMFLLHKVGRGETVGKIAREHGVTQKAIFQANELKSPYTLRVGQVLKIPPKLEARPGPITVAVGESTPSQTLEQKISEARSSEHSKKPASKKSHGYRMHKVKAGQTLGSIAKHYNVSVSELRRANDMGTSSLIRTGQKLKVPHAS